MMIKHNGYIISFFWGNWWAWGKEFATLEDAKSYIDERSE